MTVTSISSLQYSRADNGSIDMVVNDDQLGSFPFTYIATDPAPVSRQVKALIEGGTYTIAPYVAPPAPPASSLKITNLQFRKAVRAANATTALTTAIAALSAADQEYFQFTPGLLRNAPEVVRLGSQMNLTGAQLDNFFTAASKL